MVPEYLGPYKIDKIIGQGGMGCVYKAHHAKSGEPVAVKVISNSISNEQRFRRRFEAEIETLKRLRHPNIVQLIGYGEEAGNLFYSMDYVEGESLHECLRKNGAIPWEEVLSMGVDICLALKHAHDFGIIHRDLKPANLLVDNNGTVKLVDFGIAKLFGAAEMTMAGSIVGTADFMSPEQAEGKLATTRSDLYSLGSVLYAALSGRAPFAGKSVAETLYALKFTDPIPLRRMAKDIPLELAELVEQLLSKDPSLRPPTALVVSNRIKAMQQGLKKRSETAEVDNVANLDTHTSLDLNEFKDRLIDLPLGTSDRITLEADNLSKYHATDPTLLARPRTLSESIPAANEDSLVSQSTSSVGAVAPSGGSHFTTVENDTSRRSFLFDSEEQVPGKYRQLASIGIIAVALLSCIAALGYFSRSPSADELYEQIVSSLEANDIDQLSANYDALLEFKGRFPEDERVELVQAAVEEVEAARRLRSLVRRSRRESLSSTSILEEAIVGAMEKSNNTPDQSLKQLRAIQAVYGSKPDLSPSQKDLLLLVDRKQKQLSQQIGQGKIDAQNELNEVLDWGLNHLEGEKRKDFLRGLLDLYADKSWAETQVEKARAALTSSSK